MAALVTGCKSLSEHLAVSVPQSRSKFPQKKILLWPGWWHLQIGYPDTFHLLHPWKAVG